jgi:hypothetical protein
MTSLKAALTAGLLLSATASAALAGAVSGNDPGLSIGQTERTETNGFLGLTIPFGAKGVQPPKLTVGLRRATVDSEGAVRGGEVSLSLDAIEPGRSQLRAVALSGSTSLQGSLGLGITLGAMEVFATGGVHAPHLRVMGDVHPGDLSTDLSLQIDSLQELKTPDALPLFPAIVCLPGEILVGNTCLPD